MTITTMKSDDARVKWRELLDNVLVNRDEAVVIERYTKPLAVLMNYEAWQERRFTQREVEALMAAQEAELRNGPTISHEDLKAKIEARNNAAHPVRS